MQSIETIPGKTYAVTTADGCTVYRADGSTLLKAIEAGQGYFVAIEGKVCVDDDGADVRPFDLAPQQKLALMGVLGGNGALPAGYTRLEYLESPYDVIQNSSACFDLGKFAYSIADGDTLRIQTVHRVTAIPTARDGYAGKEGFNENSHVFQVGVVGKNRPHDPNNPSNDIQDTFKNYAVVYDDSVTGWDRAFSVPGLSIDTEWHRLDAFFSKEKATFNIDSQSISIKPHYEQTSIFQKLTCFGTGVNTNGETWPLLGRKKSFKFWLNGVLARDLVPCLDETGAPCMFDRVTKTPFYNAGQDDFRFPTARRTFSLRRVLPDWGQLTPHGLRRLYHVPAGYHGELYDYALENGYKPIVEPAPPEEGYWSPQWRETEDEIVLDWVETDPPEENRNRLINQ